MRDLEITEHDRQDELGRGRRRRRAVVARLLRARGRASVARVRVAVLALLCAVRELDAVAAAGGARHPGARAAVRLDRAIERRAQVAEVVVAVVALLATLDHRVAAHGHDTRLAWGVALEAGLELTRGRAAVSTRRGHVVVLALFLAGNDPVPAQRGLASGARVGAHPAQLEQAQVRAAIAARGHRLAVVAGLGAANHSVAADHGADARLTGHQARVAALDRAAIARAAVAGLRVSVVARLVRALHPIPTERLDRTTAGAARRRSGRAASLREAGAGSAAADSRAALTGSAGAGARAGRGDDLGVSALCGGEQRRGADEASEREGSARPETHDGDLQDSRS